MLKYDKYDHFLHKQILSYTVTRTAWC